MWPVFIILANPAISIGLQWFQTTVQLLAKRNAVELVLHSALEAFANTIGLRAARLRFCMVDILQC